MSETKVAREVAEAEFERLLAAHRIDPTKLDREGRESLADARRKIIDEICEGRITVDEKGQPTYSMQYEEGTATFHRPKGATLLAMDTSKKDVHRLFAAIAEMTRQPAARFSKMDMVDLDVVIAIATLFLTGR